MTAAEAALLAACRQLDDDQQEQLIAWAQFLADNYPADATDTGKSRRKAGRTLTAQRRKVTPPACWPCWNRICRPCANSAAKDAEVLALRQQPDGTPEDRSVDECGV